MNHDEKEIEPQIEARVVAWIAGEASAFEAAELERLAAERPEIGEFKQRIETTHSLIAEAARPDREPLRMSAERRAKLLATIAGSEATREKKVVTLSNASRKAWRAQRWIISMAACAALGVLVLLETNRGSFGERPARPRTATTVMEPQGQMRAEDKVQLSAFEVRSESKVARIFSSAKNLFRKSEPKENETVAVQMLESDANKRESAVKASIDREEAVKASFDHMRSQNGQTLQTNAPVTLSLSMPALSAPEPTASARAMRPGRADDANVTLGFAAGAGGEKKLAAFESLPLSSSIASGTIGGAVGVDGSVLPSTPKPSSDLVVMSPFEVSATREGSFGAIAFSASSQAPAPARADTQNDEAKVKVEETLAVTNGLRIADLGSFDTKQKLEGADERLKQLRDERAGALATNKEDTDRSSAAVKKPNTDPLPVARPAPPPPSIEETSTAKNSVSTFSLHVSDVSFRLAQAALARGQMPDVASIRPEEFYNAFDYGDPAPDVAEKIGCRIEQAAHPFLQQRNLVRIAMKVAATGRAANTPLRLTVLLDTSGSMEREDRVATVRRAIEVLVTLLGPNDRVTLIGFARTPRLLAENLPGNRAGELLDLIARTPAEGGTNIEEALKLAGEQARRHRAANAQNRIIVITDGAANLGNAIPAQLAAQIEALRQAGIAFDACGVGLDGLDDSVLEALTRKGDGRYYVLNSPEAADAGFAQKLAGAFRPAAQNVKLQVRFNPARVASYRLIGFEQHRLREEDFRNDQVDAAELAAEEAGVALYEIQPLPQGEGTLGDVFVRFRDAATGNMVENSWTMNYEPRAAAFDRATPSLQLAGTSAFLAEKLRGGPAAEQIKLRELAPVVNSLRGHYARDARVQELVTMFGQLRRLMGE